jgi:uncharacterized protein YbaP (TraB family)
MRSSKPITQEAVAAMLKQLAELGAQPKTYDLLTPWQARRLEPLTRPFWGR